MSYYKTGQYYNVLNRRRKQRQNKVNTILKARKRNRKENNDWEPWKPVSEAQEMAINSLAKYTGYGGMPGAGKSSLLLMLCNYYPVVQIFRKTSTNLDGLIRDSFNMLNGSGATYNGTKHIWKNIPGNHILQFCHLQHENSAYIYQGNPAEAKTYDEATELSRWVFSYTSKWNRSPIIGQHSRCFLTFNPPTTKDGLWVIHFFAPWIHPNYAAMTGRKPAKSGEIRWFIIDTDDKGNEIDIEVDGSQIDFFLRLPGKKIGKKQNFIDISVEEYRKYKLSELDLGNHHDIVYQYYKANNVNVEELDLVPRSRKVLLFDGVVERSPDQDQGLEPLSRTFIKGNLKDNPFYAGTDYEAVLDSFPEPMRSMFKLGEFRIDLDRNDDFQVIPSQWVQRAMDRWVDYKEAEIEVVGIDPSRGGKDDTIFAPRCGAWLGELVVIPGSELSDADEQIPGKVVAQKAMFIAPDKNIIFRVDVTGIGASPVDFLRDSGRIVIPVANNYAAVDKDKERLRSQKYNFVYADAITYLYWNMRELLDPENKIPIMLPPDEKLKEELCSHRWGDTNRYVEVETQVNGVTIQENCREIAIDSKKEVKKRIGRSPDRADAVTLAFGDKLSIKKSFDYSKFIKE